MAITLENYNIGRAAAGLDAVDKLPDTIPADIQAPVTDTSTEIKTDVVAPTAAVVAPEIQKVELTDDAVIEWLKSKNITVSSIDELAPKSKEDQLTPEQIAEKRESDKLTYGLQKGLFNKKQYESFVKDVSDPQSLVFADYAEQAKLDDPSLTDQEIQDEFADKYGLNAEEGTRKFKRGQQEIDMMADRLLKKRHQNIYKADNAFSEHEQHQVSNAERTKILTEKSPSYLKDVDEVFTSLEKFSYKIGEDSFEIEMPKDSIEKVKAHFIDKKNVEKYVVEGYTKETLKDIAQTAAIRGNLEYIMAKSNEQYLLKHQSGTRGIPTVHENIRPAKAANLTKEQQQMLEVYQNEAKNSVPKPVAN